MLNQRTNHSGIRTLVIDWSLGLGHWSFIVFAMFFLGCTPDPNKQPTSLRERQDAAMKDPYGYKPQIEQNQDISGGGIFDFDKEAMRKDMDRVFNP